MSDSRTAIVVVAFNRPKSLSRILSSLGRAHYPKASIPLIISIDRAENNLDVLEIAKAFQWNFGEKTVVYQEKNLGLRAHILQCGDYTVTYGKVIILEDDLFVSPNFYYFTGSALDFSEDKPSIGGISLYNHKFNVHAKENFNALDDGYDNWYFQFASSWGQAWSKNQWDGFKNWYEANPEIDHLEEIPQNVRNWSAKSWLKYYIAYLIATNKFFLYPKSSLTTNFSDVGTHVGLNSTAYQVPLDIGPIREYTFSSPKESNSVYDAFFENLNLWKYLGVSREDLTVDLYGYRSSTDSKYLLTSRLLDYKIIESFGCNLKPRDSNILLKVEGNQLFLYDRRSQYKNPNKLNRLSQIGYNVKLISFKDSWILFYSSLLKKFERVFSKFGF